MKKTLLKLISMMLIAAFALSACAPASPAATDTTDTTNTTDITPAAAPVELSLWHSYHTAGLEEAVINKLVADYQEMHPDVKVNILAIPFDQFFNKYETEAAAGGGPDLFTAPDDNLGNEVRSGLVAPIDDLVTGKLDGYTQSGIDGVTIEGKLYAVPGIAKAVALYYNKSTVPTPPATLDELLAMVKAGKKIAINQNVYHNFGIFTGAFGGALMDDTGKCVADQGGFAEAFQYLSDLKAAGASFETDGAKADTEFRQGQVDMIINGPWVLGDYKSDLKDNLGVAAIPAGPKGPATPMTGIDGFYINPNSKNQQAAVDLALYIFSKDGLTEYANTAGDPPARTDVDSSDPQVKFFGEVAATGFPRPQSAEFGNYWSPFGDALNAVMEGQSKPVDAVAAACAAMNTASNK